MKIKYTKKRLNTNLILGIIWAVFGFVSLIYDGLIRWLDFGYIFIAILYLGQYIYEYKQQYLTIENGVICKNSFFSKKIELNKIIRIKKFTEDYILKTENQELTINTEIVNKKSLSELNRILSELNLSSDKTPFAKSL